MRSFLAVASTCWLVVLGGVAGCSNEPPTYPVKGTVTWQGQPLPDGHVVFKPDGQNIRPDADKITNGEFAFRATQGAKRVEIWANREKPGQEKNKVMGLREKEQYIPKRYNSETTLKIEVKTTGENQYEFVLTESPPKRSPDTGRAPTKAQ